MYLWTSDNKASRWLNVEDGVTIQVLFRNHFLRKWRREKRECEREGGKREEGRDGGAREGRGRVADESDQVWLMSLSDAHTSIP